MNTTTTQTTSQKLNQILRDYRKGLISIDEYRAQIIPFSKEEILDRYNLQYEAETRIRNYKDSFRYRTKIRAFCNRHLYSDIEPYEVVKVISQTCVEIRRMDTEQTVFPKHFFIGGFSAHCADNYSQDYKYTSNPENGTRRIRLGKKGWDRGNHIMSETPINFYDYNF